MAGDGRTITRLPLVKDDGGRHENEYRDCVVRAFAIATMVPYDYWHAKLAAYGRQRRRGTMRSVFKSLIDNEWGWRHVERPGCTLKRFVEHHTRGRYLVRIRGHMLAVIDGRVHDIIHSAPGSRVIEYWVVP